MKVIYKIIPAPTAPELVLERGLADKLCGESLIALSPDRSFEGRVSQLRDWTQFYRVGTHAFALNEAAWDHCMDMYYVITENDVELLSVVADCGNFRLIHPRQFLPASSDSSQICNLTYVSALFRIENRPHQEVFCFEGMAVRGNEFKYAYDQFGFRGLIFEEVWRGE